MKVHRTPDDPFSGLPDFPYEPRYTEIEGLRIHHVEAGTGPVVLLLHGEPTWFTAEFVKASG
jgi:haloalkane dehalogenase